MGLVVVGSVALDTVETPFGKCTDALGGSATYCSVAASHFTSPTLVGVVGEDFSDEHVALLADHNIDLSGLERREGRTFRWSGRYGYDLNERETLSTCLNVFEDFDPVVPEQARGEGYLFLGNIHPEVQLAVLDQMVSPKFVACDTMNLWIETERELLLEVISRVDAVMVNDGEVRQLTGEPNLIMATSELRAMGAKMVVVKKGEHGCLCDAGGSRFFAPAYPLEFVFDPTGAGDSFAGGFMGYLARTDDLSEPAVRRAVVYGSVLASFCVEEFGLRRLAHIDEKAIERRYREFGELTAF
ncbi:sugar kinase [candidate division TA06 bacterium DG_24]|uniref:Sugar kinase n=3 Tax=Bacteria division TA06 TaxID=1156500 RepID=A0A0S8JBB4_UNCT6|nr:MAG: sugar kinase [candidate division TA06 bacterium DG_24]KPK68574.1 MAG: sugar kinase [candidate division TA06 bacterium SM23_40]KPL05771.1 MAG: sugar kinase [candidate division TA06 bacterium SM1_40]